LHLVGHFRILYHDARKHEYQMHGAVLYTARPTTVRA
jgi:hypothetical protein